MKWPLLGSADITSADVARTLDLARAFRGGASTVPQKGRTVGLLFFEPSLRTRVGFGVAAARLGAATIEVYEQRASAISMPESWSDTLRTVGGYVDVIVARPGDGVDTPEAEMDRVPYINAGGRGPNPEHPTQALIDLFAVQTLAKRPARTVVIVGDPTMRAARSLIALLTREAIEVLVVTHDDFASGLPNGTRRAEMSDALRAADVVYATGMRHGSLPLDERDQLLVTDDVLKELSPDGLVLSPMPVIDEIATSARNDPRVRFFEQSDLGLYVRMAVLAQALELEVTQQ